MRNHITGVELNQHRGVSLQVFDGDGKTEVVEDEELYFEVVELCQRKSAHLSK